ncbi:MAG: ferrous iron transport protein B [Paludibacteraceae bacterium]|nr:ferrous iron transport protein B [Paludibacteraceae bacterium]
MSSKQHIEVAIMGSRGSGKTALCQRFIEAAKAIPDAEFCFDEHHSHEEMDREEGAAREHAHDIVLQVVDATNLEQSLALTPSFIDHRHHLVLAINRYDLLLKTHHSLDMDKFAQLIGVPVHTVSATTGEGIQELLQTMQKVAQQPESHAHPIVHAWEQQDKDAYLAYVHGILTQTLIHPEQDIHSWLDRIDRVLTNRWLGFPVFAIVMSFVFWCTFSVGDPLGEWIGMGIQWLHDICVNNLPESWYSSLMAEGVILGVGSLLTALPNIIILFFFLSVMEDSGYMARVAYLMDGVMHKIGLHGRSFIPMLMGFDCNVPAIMAAKDIHDKKDRTLTMLMVPFMSCSARLPVYILFIDIFFPSQKALVLGSLYLLGIALSFGFGWLMKKTRWFRKPADDTVNELPYFHLPKLSSIGRHIWFRVSDFLQKISTVVLYASIIIWFLEYFPSHDLSQLESSWLASIGQFIAPIMAPLGMDWKLSVCLLTGLPAKEAIAATFAILFTGGVAHSGLTMLSAYTFLIFTLLYFPCVATIATLRRETNWKWALFTVVHSLLLAWVVSFVVYQIGGLLC